MPTDIAMSLIPEARTMAAAASTLQRRASGPAASEAGRVRLAASEVVGAEVLPLLLADFARRHPLIGVDLVLSNRNEDLLRNEADLAVRMVTPTQDTLVARRLGVVKLGLYARREYLDRRGMPADVAALAGHALIGPESASALAGVRIGDLPAVPSMFAHPDGQRPCTVGAASRGVGYWHLSGWDCRAGRCACARAAWGGCLPARAVARDA